MLYSSLIHSHLTYGLAIWGQSRLNSLLTYRWSLCFGQKKSQRYFANHFKALNFSFQMVHSSKSGIHALSEKIGFLCIFSDPKIQYFWLTCLFRAFNDHKSKKNQSKIWSFWPFLHKKRFLIWQKRFRHV